MDLVLFGPGDLCLVSGQYNPAAQPPTEAVLLLGGTYDPTAHLPPGIILDNPTYNALIQYWASVGGRELTADEIEAITGPGSAVPSIPREFGTGKYPVLEDHPA